MKQFSLVLNVILLVAVCILYGKVFFGKTSTPISATPTKAAGNTVVPENRIAYVEVDSLNEQIKFIKDKRTQLESDQRAIETEWQNGYRGLENQKNNFLKRGNAITQQEAEQFQQKLIGEQQQIDRKKQGLTEKLSEKSYAYMEDIQKKLKAFLAEYNKDRQFQYILSTGTGLEYMVFKDSALNISTDVISGMNERYPK